jgi:hypothetical protein
MHSGHRVQTLLVANHLEALGDVGAERRDVLEGFVCDAKHGEFPLNFCEGRFGEAPIEGPSVGVVAELVGSVVNLAAVVFPRATQGIFFA